MLETEIFAYFGTVGAGCITLDPRQIASSINVEKIRSWWIANKDRCVILPAVGAG
jgi:hypothetical protein